MSNVVDPAQEFARTPPFAGERSQQLLAEPLLMPSLSIKNLPPNDHCGSKVALTGLKYDFCFAPRDRTSPTKPVMSVSCPTGDIGSGESRGLTSRLLASAFSSFGFDSWVISRIHQQQNLPLLTASVRGIR